MAAVLLDASALLALIFQEDGMTAVANTIEQGAAMSAANVAEVAARLHGDKWTPREVANVFDELDIDVVPLDGDVALLSGQYRPGTQRLGLGLGDRACLATARLQKLPVLTADRIWLKLKIRGVKVQCIR